MKPKYMKTILAGAIPVVIILMVALLTTSVSSAASVSPFEGNWIGTHRDGTELRLAIGGGPSGPLNITITDENMTFCGGPGINRGIGLLNPQDPNLVEANMRLICAKRGERYDNYLTAVYNPTQDTLLVNSGISFHRASFNPQECVAAPSGLSGWWPGDGNASDIAYGRNANFMGDATTGPGLVDQAFALDGDGDYIEVLEDPAFDFGSGEFTIDLWVNFEELNGEQVLIEKWIQGDQYTPSQGWTLTKLANQAIRLAVINESGLEVDLDSLYLLDLQPDSWYHFAATRQGQLVKLYLNGTTIASGDLGVLNLDSPALIKFGHRGIPADTPGSTGDQAYYLHGSIDEVEIYNGTVLTQEQIFGIYLAREFGKCKIYFPNTPSIRAHPVWDNVDIWFWPADKTLQLTVDDQGTATIPDITLEKSSNDKMAGTVWFDLAPYILKPGDVITVTDGFFTKTMTVSNLTITSVDVSSGKVEGSADPGTSVRLPTPVEVFVTADVVTGYWEANFGSCVLVPETWMIAEEFESDGDLTSFEFWIPAGQ